MNNKIAATNQQLMERTDSLGLVLTGGFPVSRCGHVVIGFSGSRDWGQFDGTQVSHGVAVNKGCSRNGRFLAENVGETKLPPTFLEFGLLMSALFCGSCQK